MMYFSIFTERVDYIKSENRLVGRRIDYPPVGRVVTRLYLDQNLRFKSRSGQIGYSVANGPHRSDNFLERSCNAADTIGIHKFPA